MRYLIACIGFIIVIVRIFFPDIKFDNISLIILIFCALILLIPDITELISRITKFKVGDFEIELKEKLEKLNNETKEIEEKTTSKNTTISNDDFINKIAISFNEPRASLILIAAEIEKISRNIVIKSGLSKLLPATSWQLLQILEAKGYIQQEVRWNIKNFLEVRNKVAHGQDIEITNSQLYELVDVGLRIIKLLRIAESEVPSNELYKTQDDSTPTPS